MNKNGLLFFLLMILKADLFSQGRPDRAPLFFGQEPPGEKPVRFAEKIITNDFYPHSEPIISPRMDRIYWSTFLDTTSGDLALFYSDFDGNTLSAPKKDRLFAAYPFKSFIYSSDGKRILFGTQMASDAWNGRQVYGVWYCERKGSGWSAPQPFENTLDTSWASLGAVSINSKGDLYFVGRLRGSTAKIYCSRFENGEYQRSAPLPETVNTGITVDPFIDPQDRFLLFGAARREENVGIIDLYISFRGEDGGWGKPVNLGANINTPHMNRFPMVTQDGRYLFFVTSHGNHFPSGHTHFYWVSAKVLDALRPSK